MTTLLIMSYLKMRRPAACRGGFAVKKGVLKAACHTLFICLAVATPVEAYDLAVGVKAGLSSPYYTGNDYRDWLTFLEQDLTATYGYDFDFHSKWKTGLSAGAFFTLGLTRGFALQPELLLTAAGGAYGYDESDYYYAFKMTDQLRILELPLLAVGRLQHKRRELKIFVGPAPCLRIGEVGVRLEENGYVASGEYAEDQFARLFLSMICGGGLTFFLHGGYFVSLETRFSLGLTPVMNSDRTGLESWKQSSFQVLAGFGRLLTGKKSLRSRLR